MNPAAMQPLILAVDDEANNLQLLRQILQDQYRLLYAKDGARALELAAGMHAAQAEDMLHAAYLCRLAGMAR